jgi:hypothetical protein
MSLTNGYISRVPIFLSRNLNVINIKKEEVGIEFYIKFLLYFDRVVAALIYFE